MESTCQTDQVPDRHRRPTITGRPDQADKEAAETILKANGWSVDAFVVAAVLWCLDNPEAALRTLEPFKPEDQPRGRPPKSRDERAAPQP